MTTDSGLRLTADGIYRKLRDRICLLDLQPGAPLPEQALAAEYGVSRTPIREVLTMLRIDNLVTRQPGGGASVSTVDFKSIRDVYSLRMKLAELIADFMIVPVPVAVVERLRSLRNEVVAAGETRDPRLLGMLYNQLHEAMLDTINNDPLRTISDRLYRQTARLWVQLLPEMNRDEEVRVILGEIDATVEALDEHDARRLARIRATYMTSLLERFNAYLRSPLIY